MKKERPSVLFITPGASPVGGNIFFLNFLKWFKQNSDTPFLTVYGHEGELAGEFAALGEAYQFDHDFSEQRIWKKGLDRLSQRMDLRNRRLRKQLEGKNIGLVYSNAVTNYRILSALPKFDAPVISHCHELESVIRRMGLDEFEKTKEMTTLFIAASEAVKKNLADNHSIDEKKIEVIREFIPIEEYSTEQIKANRAEVMRELNIPENAFIVGGSGTLYWRKAPEIFALIANEVHKKMPDAPIYFVWVGGATKGDFRFFELEFDLERLGLVDKVRFLAHTADPQKYYSGFDVFLLTSREDPYPLVCLEAAALGKPVMCFENSGGMPEFIEQDCGFTVPYLDIGAAAEKIFYLAQNPAEKNSLGAAAAKKVRERHDINVAAPKMLALIETYLSK
ncbi:MAG TPA: glycosyltransferase family 4 protein [Pyrinomonadaceae bacterium]|jgi:glycosyltransferase involved in cell wall biosynthesis|nr:glycosyltransferase family 4 protein [Pyrinomonadaceae bacterium]